MNCEHDAPVVADDRATMWVSVGQRPERIIPVARIGEVDGFRFADADYGRADDGQPAIGGDRGYVTDPTERERLAAYLAAGATFYHRDSWRGDLYDTARPVHVPAGARTDGTWIWPLALEYYLERYHIGLEPAHRRWIADRGHDATPVTPDVPARAMAAFENRRTMIRAAVARYLEQHPWRTRVPGDVEAELRRLGWHPGRDLSARIQVWLDGWAADLADVSDDPRLYPPYVPIPAARKVFHHYGGIRRDAGGSGHDGFVIYPAGDADDLLRFADGALMLGDRLQEPTFQIGEVPGRGALVIDGLDRVFVVGEFVDHYLGADIHEALTRLIRGIPGQQLNEVGL